MKQYKLIILLTLLMSMVGAKTFAHDIEVANADGVTIYYKWANNNKTELSVSYQGDSYYSYSNEYTGNVVIPPNVTYNGNTYPVTSIGSTAFYECSSLTSVTIPNSVTSIDNSAFNGCKGLTSVTIPNSITSIGNSAFYNCSGLTNIIIGNSVTTIGNYAFQSCSSLTSISIPNSVTSIGYYAFEGCSGLTSMTIPNSVTSIENMAFYNCSNLKTIKVEDGNSTYDSRNNCNAIIETASNKLIAGCKNTTIPNSVTSIGASAFSNCKGLTSIIIPNSVTTIGNSAFRGCTGLNSIDIPNSVTSIESSTFYGCSGLTGVTIPNSVTRIYSYAFYGCSGLTGVNIPNSITSIGSYAFYNCSSLASVTIPNSVISIDQYAFSGCSSLTSVTIPNSVTSIGSSAFSGCTGKLTINCNIPDASSSYYSLFKGSLFNQVSIGSNVTTIGNYAFYNCSSINTLSLPASLESIGQAAFYGCSNLKNVNIPNSVTSIGRSAFYNCSSLTSVTIPNSVTSIGSYTFEGCSGLTSVTIPNSVTSIDQYAFSGCSGLTSVTIPNSVTSIDQYAFSGCSGLTSITIPNSVTSIDQYAFSGCSGLTSITIPNSVTSIGSYAFQNCSGLTNVNISDIAAWCNISFNILSNPLGYAHHLYLNGEEIKVLTIPNSVTSIGSYTFEGCSALTSVTIPNSVTSIGQAAFYGCSGLTSVTIPNSVTSIGSSAFSGCSGLTSVTIPSSVTSLSSSAFSGCTSLQSINFSGSVNYTTIDGVVYDKDVTKIITYPQGKTSTTYTYPSTITTLGGISNNPYLKRIYVPKLSSTPSISTYTFNVGENLEAVEFEDYIGDYYTKDGVVYKKYEYNGESQNYLIYCPRGKKSLTLSPDVKYVYVDGFRPTSLLESITIEPNEQSISFYSNSDYSTDMAFHSPLKSLNIGRQINIGNSLYKSKIFAQNPELETVVIGENMTYIPSDLFVNCSRLTHVTLPETITSVGSNAFAGTPWLASLPTLNGVKYYNYIALEYKYSEETKNVRLKDGISVVAGGLFKDTDVESVELPTSVTSLESSLFYGCKSLKDVVLPNSIKTISNSLDIGYGNSGSIDGVVENIHVPSSVTWIGRYAINQCDTVVIEDGITGLGLQDRNADDGYWDGTFSGVKKLYVGRNTGLNGSSYSGEVFCALNSSSTQLSDIIFGPLVTNAFTGTSFRNCNHVNSVTCLGKEPFSSPNFYIIPQTAVLYVPLGSKQRYASADGWSKFDNITEVTEVTINMDDTEMVYAGDFDLDFCKVKGLKAYVASDFDAETSTITLERAQLVSAGKGVILKGAKGTYTVPCANIEPTAADALCGTISGRFIRNTEGENVNYSFDKTEHVFKPVDAAYGSLISRNGAYLSLPASSVSGNGNITLQYKEWKVMGDADGDGFVDVADVVAMIDYILDSSTSDIVFFSADMNDDAEVDIFDVMIVINIVLNKGNSAESRTRASGNMEEQAVVTAAADGIVLGVNDAGRFTAFQFDIEVADGMELTAARLNDNTGNHELYSMNIGQNTYRVIGVSMDNSTLTASGNDLIELSFSKGGHVQISNIVFVTPQKSKVYFACGNSEVTGIGRIGYKQAEEIYDLSGRKVNTDRSRLPKGLYIINNKKVVIK